MALAPNPNYDYNGQECSQNYDMSFRIRNHTSVCIYFCRGHRPFCNIVYFVYELIVMNSSNGMIVMVIMVMDHDGVYDHLLFDVFAAIYELLGVATNMKYRKI